MQFETLLRARTPRAKCKEQVRWFWARHFRRFTGNARKFFNRWYGWATCSQLGPIVRIAKMLNRHLENTLSYFRHGNTNAMSEGFISRIQSIKSQARGFLAFENYRARILNYFSTVENSTYYQLKLATIITQEPEL